MRDGHGGQVRSNAHQVVAAYRAAVLVGVPEIPEIALAVIVFVGAKIIARIRGGKAFAVDSYRVLGQDELYARSAAALEELGREDHDIVV